MIRTDAPKSAPFKVGTKVKYLGHMTYSYGYEGSDGKMTLAKFPGMVATVVGEKYGYKGTGRLIEETDDGEKVYDETNDFCSVIENEYKVQICINREDKKDWKIIKEEV